MPKRTFSSSPAGKKRPSKRVKNPAVAHLDLPIDALGIVMQFLAPRELYLTAFTCKDMLQFVTVQLVVRSALLHGGSPRKTVEALYPLMQNMSIHPVSALRLLRLVNCKRCEHCQRSSMRTIRPDYGVALCFRACLVGEGFAEKQFYIPRDWAQHPRVVVGEWKSGSCYVWNRTLEQCGEACGPLLTLDELEDGNQIEELLQNAPPEEAYREFVQTYEEFEQAAVAAQEERQDKLERKEEEKKQKFQDRVFKMIEKIKSKVVVDDLSRRDLIMSVRPPTPEEQGHRPVPVLVFKCPAVDALVRHYVHFPNECRATEAREIAGNISSYLDTIEESQCMSFAFLSEADPFEMKLKQYCQEKYLDLNSFLGQPRADQTFFQLLSKGRCFDAILYSIFQGKFMATFLEQFCGVLQYQELLAHYVWQNECNVHKTEEDSRKRLGKVYVSFMTAFPKCLEKVAAYSRWLTSKNNSLDISGVERNVLKDPACFEYLLKNDFEGLRQYKTNPSPGVGFRVDDLLRKSVGFAEYFLAACTG